MSGPRLLPALCAAVLAAACDSPAPPPAAETAVPSAPPPAAQTQYGPPGSSYALRATENSWPRLTEQSGDTPVERDVFARSYYVVLDGSGSMKKIACSGIDSKLDAARAALASFAQGIPEDTLLGLSVFDGAGLGERLPLGRGNQSKFVDAVNDIRANGDTPLRSAVAAAYDALREQARRQLGYGEYHLVIVTDGFASEGEDPTAAVAKILSSSPVLFHTIGFCINDDHPLNQPGRTFYRAANDFETLRRGLGEVLAEAPSFSLSAFGE